MLPLTVDAQGKKTARVGGKVSCRENKGHKWEEKLCKYAEHREGNLESRKCKRNATEQKVGRIWRYTEER